MAERRMEVLASRERWSATQMREFQLGRLNELWAHASEHVPFYRRLAVERKLPRRFESIEHYVATMPVLSKQSIRQRPEDFLSARAGRGRWRSTSGSTGVPMRFFASHETHQAVLACQYRFRQAWGLDLFDRAAFLNGRSASIIDCLRNRIRIPVHQLGREQLAARLDRLERFKPAYLYGYSRAIHLLAIEAAAGNFACDSLRVVMMTSEPVFPHMIAAAEKAFRVPAVIEYGSTESGVTAYEWPDRKLRVRSDRVIVETLPREDGRFDIVKTVLDNADFPLFRYRIEDVTDAPLTETDHGFPVLHNIAGRNDDVLYAEGDVAVHPAEIDAIFEGGKLAVRRYRLHQYGDGEIEVQVEPSGRVIADSIRRAIEAIVPGREINVRIVETIAQTAAGKHKLITSDYSAERLSTPASS